MSPGVLVMRGPASVADVSTEGCRKQLQAINKRNVMDALMRRKAFSGNTDGVPTLRSCGSDTWRLNFGQSLQKYWDSGFNLGRAFSGHCVGRLGLF